MNNTQECPVCGSSQIRARRVWTLLDLLRAVWGEFPARCEHCSARFHVSNDALSSILYAKCPRCLRQDLSTWDVKHYRASTWMRFQVLLGSHRWRCDVCRCNFVSLKPRKARYVRPADRVIAGEASDVRGSESACAARVSEMDRA